MLDSKNSNTFKLCWIIYYKSIKMLEKHNISDIMLYNVELSFLYSR